MQDIIDRFISYITVDTMSDPQSDTVPTTAKQWNLARQLEAELKQIGMEDVELDENCYLMATLPSNLEKQVPTIGFVSHIDTSPDFIADKVNPQIHRNYDGGDIVLNAAGNIVLSPVLGILCYFFWRKGKPQKAQEALSLAWWSLAAWLGMLVLIVATLIAFEYLMMTD